MMEFLGSFVLFLAAVVLVQVVVILLGVIWREVVVKSLSMILVVLIVRRWAQKNQRPPSP